MPIQLPYPPMPETTPSNKYFVLLFSIDPNLSAFRSATGLAPIVKTSLSIPPTPVAAP